MTMEIDKICRTCLGLSGPLLSIHDGKSGAFSIGDMLHKFARIKAQQDDKMPDKVCLTCISEINHCYSFLLKCENSNRTLRQLIPEALAEEVEIEDVKLKRPETKVQSTQTPLTRTYSRLVQTANTQLKCQATQTIVPKKEMNDTLLVYNQLTGNDELNSQIIYELNEMTDDIEVTQVEAVKKVEDPPKVKEVVSDPLEYDDFILEADALELMDVDSKDSKTEIKSINFTIMNNEEGDPEVVINRLEPIVEETSPKRLKFFCDRCKAGFARQKSLQFHRNLNACQVPNFECDQCKRVFITERNLKEHKATHAKQDSCNLCNKVFSTPDELSKHMVSQHKRNMRNQCRVCKKVFSMVSALKDHQRVHTGERPFLCTICGKAFSQNANLQQHIRRHSNDKKFKCDECSNSYVTKAELASHRRSHTGDTPFKCEFCSSTFTTSSSLLKHRRKHTGERPYACDICPMRFAALNVLKNHRRTHTGEQPYKCSYCSKGFAQRGDCLIHLRTHTGVRSYACFCGDKFTHRATLRAHMKRHGNKEDKNQHTEASEDSNAAEYIYCLDEKGEILNCENEND